MENNPQSSLEEKVDELMQESPKAKQLKTTLVLKGIGFGLLLLSFAAFMLKRGTEISPVFRTGLMAAALLGFAVYFAARAVEITRAYRKKDRR